MPEPLGPSLSSQSLSDYFSDDFDAAAAQLAAVEEAGESAEAGPSRIADDADDIEDDEDELLVVDGHASSDDLWLETNTQFKDIWRPALEPAPEEDMETSQGPPTTQATTGSTSQGSRTASKASLNSAKSLPVEVERNIGKGKKRAEPEDDPEHASRPSKVSKISGGSLADCSRPTLKASTSVPVAGPSRPVSARSTTTPAPVSRYSRSVSVASKAVTPGPAPGDCATIAHNQEVQGLFDRLQIAWGVQYEIARGITNGSWTWEDVTREKLEKLRGKNVESAFRVRAVLLDEPARNQTDREFELWSELDREQLAILEDRNRGLGFPPDEAASDWDPRWYGGQIQQVVELKRTLKSSIPKYQLTLRPMQKGRSFRFARALGSRHILQLKIADTRGDLEQEKQFLQQKFVLCGRIFVPFSVKDGKAYMLEVNEDYERHSSDLQGDQYRLTLEAFVMCHNPIDLNTRQPVAKWATRYDLGLSTSIPAIRFEPHKITVIEDLHAPHDGGKVPAEKILTDGCGFVNAAALMKVKERLNRETMPTAIQGRVYGSKGLWILHPDPRHQSLDPSEVPEIWIRESQQKIKLVEDEEGIYSLSPVHLIFDLLAASRAPSASRLSRLSIINLAENKVPPPVFVKLMKQGLQKAIAPLMQWEGRRALELLAGHVDKACGVSTSRLQEMAAGAQRALGLTRGFNHDTEPDEVTESGLPATVAASACYLSDGKPPSLGETVVRMLQSGFDPKKEQYLFDQLDRLREYEAENYIMQYHIAVPMSLEAFIAPDPTGELKEGEICFTSSKPLENPRDIWDPFSMDGEVLVFRNPTRLPSDVRKVRAVRCNKLTRFRDVIFFSVKGSHSLASVLAGGDYDGDVAVMIWDPDLTEKFENKEICRMEPNFLDDYFEPEGQIVTVDMLRAELKRVGGREDHINSILQKHLLHGLTPSKVGMYSVMHENAIYTLGYRATKTIRIAHMFNTLLDSRKSGLIVRKSVFEADEKSRIWNEGVQAECFAGADKSRKNVKLPERRGLFRFILDDLWKAGKEIKEEQCLQSDTLRKELDFTGSEKRDSTIKKALEDCKELLTEDEWNLIKTFVDGKYKQWTSLWIVTPRKRKGKQYDTKAKQKEDKQVDKAKVRELTQSFCRGPDDPLFTGITNDEKLRLMYRTMAAYAYALKPKFAFTVAFNLLCRIKAEKAPGGTVTVTTAVYDMLAPSSMAMRIMGAFATEPPS